MENIKTILALGTGHRTQILMVLYAIVKALEVAGILDKATARVESCQNTLREELP